MADKKPSSPMIIASDRPSFLSSSRSAQTPTQSVSAMMDQVILALIPAILVQVYFFGIGVLIQILIAIIAAICFEAFIIRIRNQSIKHHLSDHSALVTAILVALCVPPTLPWWQMVLAMAFAIIIIKQLYGGLGHNPFNPAMAAFAFLVVSFPLTISQWPAPATSGESLLAMQNVVAAIFDAASIDAYTMATPLDSFRQLDGYTVAERFDRSPSLTALSGPGAMQINLAILLGGLYLIYRGIIGWQLPVAFISSLGLIAMLFYDGGSSQSLGSPLFHWFSGATMLAAFFILTDPVTAPRSLSAKIYFAIGAAILTFIIRSWGGYPDGVAFAVLLMNFAAPLMDRTVYWRQDRQAALAATTIHRDPIKPSETESKHE